MRLTGLALIIDIRENGGGEDSVSQQLLRHLTEKPFRLLPYLDSEMRQYYRGEVGTLSDPRERPLVARPRAEPFFEGPVCVLTGLHTGSAAVEFAEAVKFFGLATIVGEETGGQPNSFGNGFPFMLPRSRLTVTIATSSGIRANGNIADFSPVKPDIVVRTTAADMRRGFDPILERAKNCPARSIR